MANKAISELPQAQNVNNQDLFVLEQSGIAKKLTAETFITEQGIIDALAEALDGHGGIQSVTLSSVSGRIRTYRITFTDQSATTFQVYDGTSIDRIAKTSTAGLVDTYTIFMSDGTTSFFTVSNGADGNVSEAMLNDALKDKAPAITETTESSAIANFTDGADDLVMHNIVAEINPVQSGSGDPSPSNVRTISGWTGCNVTRTGKNLIDTSNITDYSKWSADIAPSGNMASSWTNRIYSLPALKSGAQYTISFGITSASFPEYLYFGYYKDGSATRVAYVTTGVISNQSITFTAIAGVTYCLRMGAAGSEDTFNAQIAKLTYIQAELGSTATTYESYQDSSVTVDWTTEAGTVYGGTIDVATGELTVDRAIVDMGTLNWNKYETQFYAQLDGAKSPPFSELPNALCSLFKPVSNASVTYYDNAFAINASQSRVNIVASAYDTAANFKTAMSGQTLVYELATPQTYQLTPQQLMTLLGTNNVWADTGNVSVTYPADTKMFIEKLTQPTEDDMVANQAITSGKYFMIGNSLYLALANIASGAAITIGTNAQRVSLADALNNINS